MMSLHKKGLVNYSGNTFIVILLLYTQIISQVQIYKTFKYDDFSFLKYITTFFITECIKPYFKEIVFIKDSYISLNSSSPTLDNIKINSLGYV